MQQSNNHGNAAVALGDGGGAMAYGEACWAAIEGSSSAGPWRQWLKMSNKGVDSNIVQREGRSTHWDK
jgi:hypothetical protein